MKEESDSNNEKPIIAVTMATGLQGKGVIKELSKRNKYIIRAITRNPNSKIARELLKFKNVELIKGDLLDLQSLKKCFKNAYGIFGNTTPTKGFKPLVREYEIEQGRTLINAVRDTYKEGFLKHFVFSSICKAKDPLKNEPAPGHFSSKWDIENYLFQNELNDISTIIRPASYFENFIGDLPGLRITETTFPGVVNPKKIWQTIAVQDVGIWTAAIFSNPKKFISKSLNLAGEEMTGQQMANLLESINDSNSKKVNYIMIPRLILKLFIHDIGIMADWIERTGYGANIDQLKLLAKEEGISITSLSSWLRERVNEKT